MVTITCPTEKNLFIPALQVQFVDGVAEVPQEYLELLVPYTVHGVVLPDTSEVSDDAEAVPAKKAGARAKAVEKPFG